MIGRTHGIHAEPTTFGAKVALWALQLDRDRTRLTHRDRHGVGVQAVGRRRDVLEHRPGGRGVRRDTISDLRPVPATQVIARDRHAELLSACASAAATCEMIAVELRHLQRTEVGEVLEGFKPGPKGLVGDAPQAQPDLGRNDQWARPSRALEPARRAAGCRALARARHLAFLGRADHPSRLDDARSLLLAPLESAADQPERECRTDEVEPVGEPRTGVQSAGPARVGRRRDVPRRRLSRRATQRDADRGSRRRISGSCSKATPT